MRTKVVPIAKGSETKVNTERHPPPVRGEVRSQTNTGSTACTRSPPTEPTKLVQVVLSVFVCLPDHYSMTSAIPLQCSTN